MHAHVTRPHRVHSRTCCTHLHTHRCVHHLTYVHVHRKPIPTHHRRCTCVHVSCTSHHTHVCTCTRVLTHTLHMPLHTVHMSTGARTHLLSHLSLTSYFKATSPISLLKKVLGSELPTLKGPKPQGGAGQRSEAHPQHCCSDSGDREGWLFGIAGGSGQGQSVATCRSLWVWREARKPRSFLRGSPGTLGPSWPASPFQGSVCLFWTAGALASPRVSPGLSKPFPLGPRFPQLNPGRFLALQTESP